MPKRKSYVLEQQEDGSYVLDMSADHVVIVPPEYSKTKVKEYGVNYTIPLMDWLQNEIEAMKNRKGVLIIPDNSYSPIKIIEIKGGLSRWQLTTFWTYLKKKLRFFTT